MDTTNVQTSVAVFFTAFALQSLSPCPLTIGVMPGCGNSCPCSSPNLPHFSSQMGIDESLKIKTQHSVPQKGIWWTIHGPYFDRCVWPSPDPMRPWYLHSLECIDFGWESEGRMYWELSVLCPIPCIILCDLYNRSLGQVFWSSLFRWWEENEGSEQLRNLP